MTNTEIFEKFGCVRLNGFIDPVTVTTISQYFENRIIRGEWPEGQEGKEPVTKLFYYADPLIEVVLKTSQKAIEEAAIKSLCQASLCDAVTAIKPKDVVECEPETVEVQISTASEILEV